MIFESLLHRYPLLLVDRVISVENNTVRALKNITFNDKVFKGHFPNQPIYPGIYIIEGLCQCAQVLHGSRLAVTAKLDSFKFLKTVMPGDQLIYEVSFDSQMGPFVISKAKAYVAENLVCSGTIVGQEFNQ